MRRIETAADIEAGLAHILAVDPRLRPVAERAGPVPLRRNPGGFEGLAAVVMGQQISTNAAAAIWARLRETVDPFTPAAFLATPEETLRTIGLSRSKINTVAGVASICIDGFDLDSLDALPAEKAMTTMTSLRGIGPWTAEIYLLFCVGHADIFPAGDLALQSAAQHGLGLAERPSEKALRAIAAGWSPWRGVAARLLWAYYRVWRSNAASTPIPGAELTGG